MENLKYVQVGDLNELAEAQREFLLNIADQVRKMVATTRELVPVAFLYNSEAKEATIVGTSFDGENSKDAFAEALHNLAAKIDADLLIFVSESWTLDAEDGKEYMENRDRYPRGMVDHPRRKEIVSFMVSTHDQDLMGKAEILRGENSRRLSDVLFMKGGAITGRFANLLRPRTGH